MAPWTWLLEKLVWNRTSFRKCYNWCCVLVMLMSSALLSADLRDLYPQPFLRSINNLSITRKRVYKVSVYWLLVPGTKIPDRWLTVRHRVCGILCYFGDAPAFPGRVSCPNHHYHPLPWEAGGSVGFPGMIPREEGAWESGPQVPYCGNWLLRKIQCQCLVCYKESNSDFWLIGSGEMAVPITQCCLSPWGSKLASYSVKQIS